MKALIITALVLILNQTSYAAKVGGAAPAFAARDSQGASVKLADFNGKYVVLEWHNRGCPFVKKHYESGNMQKLQAKAKGMGVVWLTVISSKKGKQGYATPDEANAYAKREHAEPAHILLDADASMAKLYEAKTTPHMFVIGPDSKIIYQGAVDDKATTDIEDVAFAKNYVMSALEESMAGKPVTVSSTQPYGCGVKY